MKHSHIKYPSNIMGAVLTLTLLGNRITPEHLFISIGNIFYLRIKFVYYSLSGLYFFK